jgi:hypothetical protein
MILASVDTPLRDAITRHCILRVRYTVGVSMEGLLIDEIWRAFSVPPRESQL